MSDFTDRLRATGGKGQGGPVKQQAADLIDEMEKALRRSQIALNDWLALYAPDLHDDASVKEAQERVALGTIGYIAQEQAAITATLSKLEAMK